MNPENAFAAAATGIILAFLGFVSFAIYIEKSTHLECVALLKDKPAIEILGVCK